MPQPDLFIPRKMDPKAHPGYQHDMRDIEMWTKGLTSGGTSGAVAFVATFGAGTGAVAVGWQGYSPTNVHLGSFASFMPIFAGDTGYPPGAFSSGSVVDIEIGGGGGVFIPASAATVNFFQNFALDGPSFTGPTSTIELTLILQAVQLATSVPSSNAFNAKSKVISLSSGGSHNFTSSDFTSPTIVGTDLTFSGTPLHLTTTGGLPYFVSWNVIATWDTANTLTQA